MVSRVQVSRNLKSPTQSRQKLKRRVGATIFIIPLLAVLVVSSILLAAATPQSSTKPSSVPAPAQQTTAPALPRGKKLVLKDGTFQLVREYEVEGDRVRYYSIDQMGWEEIPESLVDWDATKKLGMEEAKRNVELIAKARKDDKARHAEPLDVDASLEIAPKVFLPPGDGLFEFDGKAIYPLSPAEPDFKYSKTQRMKQVMVPIPIIPTRHTVTLDGTRAKFRMRSSSIEFYMRTGDAHEPSLDLIQAKVKGGKRLIENLDQLFGQKEATGRVTVPILRWEIARGVYRFTIEQPLEPGEYAVAETIEAGGTNLYLWDFGVDPGTSSAKQATN
jgi:hypothetical protein